MPNKRTLDLSVDLPVLAKNAGLFVSRGMGTHPTRIIDSHELIFVRSGRLCLFEEQRRFEMNAGEVLHLWPGREHGGTAAYPADLSFYWIHFQVLQEGARSKQGITLPQHGQVARPERLTELYRRYIDDQESGRLTQTSGALLLTLMLEEISASGLPEAGHPSDGAAALAARAGQFMLAHFHEPISASDVAAGISCNPNYLGRVFKKVRNMTMTEAIQYQRMRQARTLLMDSTLNVNEVARQCGFSEAGYFRRVFRKTEGLTPLAYRRLYARIRVNTE